jgi:hypothetical protein
VNPSRAPPPLPMVGAAVTVNVTDTEGETPEEFEQAMV